MSQKLEKHGFCWIISKHLFLEREGERVCTNALYTAQTLEKQDGYRRTTCGILYASKKFKKGGKIMDLKAIYVFLLPSILKI